MPAPEDPALLRLFPPPPHRFEMGMRRGNGDYFRLAAKPEAVLAERRDCLRAHPDRHLLFEAGGEDALQEAAAFAAALNPGHIDASRFPESPVERCAALGGAWDPDFLLLSPTAEGWQLKAGVVCFPSMWVPEEKLGRPMSWIHGPVPGLQQSLGRRIDAFLEGMKPGADWERSNWGLAATPELNAHPARRLPRLGPDATLGHTWLRVEDQALRKLPESGCVLFGIRVRLHRLSEIVTVPGVAEGLRDALESMPDELIRYKALTDCRSTLIRQLTETGAEAR